MPPLVTTLDRGGLAGMKKKGRFAEALIRNENGVGIAEVFIQESPPDQKIPFHHEMAQMRFCRLFGDAIIREDPKEDGQHSRLWVPKFLSKLFFFCEEEPGSGGETPIVLRHYVYERMKEKYPEFVEKLEELGLIYTRVLGAGDDPSSPIGRGGQLTFLTKDMSAAEERAAQLGMKLEWMEDGVKTIMGPIPAIKFDETRGRKIWFNSMGGCLYWLERCSK